MKMSKILLLQKYEEEKRKESLKRKRIKKKMEEKYKEVKKTGEYRKPCHDHNLDEYCNHHCPMMGVDWPTIDNKDFEELLSNQLNGDIYEEYISSMKTFESLGGDKILKTPEQKKLWKQIKEKRNWG